MIKLNLGEPDFNVPFFIKIATQIFTSRTLTVSPEQVVIFPGVKPAIGFSTIENGPFSRR